MPISYQKALVFLNALQSKGINPRLENIALALARFGHPQLLFPSIHIAGTNGKGSTAAMVANILRVAGYKVGLFTSPHLHSVRERIQINAKCINKKDFSTVTNYIKNHLGVELTYFEFLTLLCFLHFAQNKIDIGVIEVGLGGRLDATNLLLPKLSIITNIHLEHKHWLGRYLRKIALEKGGIIKTNTPLITGTTQKKLLALFKKLCQLKNAPFYWLGKDIRYRMHQEEFSYFGLKRHFSSLRLGLNGAYQIKNATLALGAIEILEKNGLKVRDEDIKKGLMKLSWPGRFEFIKRSPTIILDGAHNPSGAATLKKSLYPYKDKRLILVLGIMRDKDIKGMIKILAPLAQTLISTSPHIPRAARAELLNTISKDYCLNKIVLPSISEAVKTALSIAEPKDLILITGSLYTVAEAREALGKACKEK